MPDVYTSITSADSGTVDRLVGILEQRATDHRQVAMRQDYLDHAGVQPGTVVLEVGCGTGVIARDLARRQAQVIAVDPSEQLIAAARRLSSDQAGIRWHVADATRLPLDDHQVDVVVFHTVLCHLRNPLAALAEARRVLRPGGHLAVFDGDYASLTFARDRHDPLETAAQAAIAEIAHDPYLVRRLPGLLRQAGFSAVRHFHYLYRADDHPAYLHSLTERGIDALVRDGRSDAAQAAALRSEVAQRIATGAFLGQVGYGAVIARPDDTTVRSAAEGRRP